MLLTLLLALNSEQVQPFVCLSNDLDDGDLRMLDAVRRLRVPVLQSRLAVLRRNKYLNPRGAVFLAGALVSSTRHLVYLIRKHNIDLVQSNTSTVLSGAAAARIAGVHHVWHVHEIFRPTDGRIFPPLLQDLADRVVVVSNTAAESLLGYKPSLASKLTVIKNAVDPTPFEHVHPQEVSLVREELGIEPDSPVVGMVGRIGLGKGEENFVQVARRVAERNPSARFVIAGGTFDRRDHLLDDLRAAVRSAGMEGRIIVTGLRTDIPVLMNLFDLLVHLPARPESFGLVAAEAMSAAKPVVTWDLGALPEIVAHGETGYVVPCGDLDAAAEGIGGLLSNVPLRISMGQMGKRLANREYTPQRYAEQFQSVYRELVS